MCQNGYGSRNLTRLDILCRTNPKSVNSLSKLCVFSSSVPNLRSPVFGPKSFSVLCLWSPVCPALPIASCPACSGCSSSAGPGGRLPVPWPVAVCVQGAARFVEPCLHGAPRAGARPKVPGACRGPQVAENPPKTRGCIYHFILPEICPVWVLEGILAGFVWHHETAV